MTELRSSKQELARFRRRVLVAALFVFACFCVLGIRFYYLQIVRHDYYHSRAEGNRIALLPVVPTRGVITDRNGIALARNYSVYTLEINPTQAKDLDKTIDQLSTVIEISDRDRKRFEGQVKANKYFDSTPIRSHLTEEDVARLVAQRYRFPGVEIQSRLFRDYPTGSSAAHIVGYIGNITESDIERLETNNELANYRGSEYIGRTGLEFSYEKELHGTTGVEQVEINVRGRAVRLLSQLPAASGSDLELSLDIKLQQAIEAALDGRRGAVVAIEPATGEVLAMVSAPSFDPNAFVKGMGSAEWNILRDSPDHPLNNRTIGANYPPGSIFKPFMALAGLETGKRTVEQRFNNQGVFNFAELKLFDRKWNCQNNVNVHRSIVYSCNVYYYQLASDLGIDALSGFMRKFGFGARTGIDIPGEITGVLPTPTWKRTEKKQPWYGGDTLSIGIGQGFNSYTPLQMASAMATLVNNGVAYRPHIVKHIVNPKNGSRQPVAAEPVALLNFQQQNVDTIKQAMAEVVRIGTAAKAFAGAPYTAGGKTGTAQLFSQRSRRYVEQQVKEHLRDHAWFLGFAPVENPSIVLAVLVENGGFGSQSAAPVARKIFDYYLVDRYATPAPENENADNKNTGKETGQ